MVVNPPQRSGSCPGISAMGNESARVCSLGTGFAALLAGRLVKKYSLPQRMGRRFLVPSWYPLVDREAECYRDYLPLDADSHPAASRSI